MKDTGDSEAVPCRDIDPAKLFEQGVAPEAYHNLREVTEELITDCSSFKIILIEEQCSRCSAKFSGLHIRGDVSRVMQDLKWSVNEVYEACFEESRSVQYVDIGQQMVALEPDEVLELFKSLQLAASLAREDAGDESGKRSKQEIWAQIVD